MHYRSQSETHSGSAAKLGEHWLGLTSSARILVSVDNVARGDAAPVVRHEYVHDGLIRFSSMGWLSLTLYHVMNSTPQGGRLHPWSSTLLRAVESSSFVVQEGCASYVASLYVEPGEQERYWADLPVDYRNAAKPLLWLDTRQLAIEERDKIARIVGIVSLSNAVLLHWHADSLFLPERLTRYLRQANQNPKRRYRATSRRLAKMASEDLRRIVQSDDALIGVASLCRGTPEGWTWLKQHKFEVRIFTGRFEETGDPLSVGYPNANEQLEIPRKVLSSWRNESLDSRERQLVEDALALRSVVLPWQDASELSVIVTPTRSETFETYDSPSASRLEDFHYAEFDPGVGSFRREPDHGDIGPWEKRAVILPASTPTASELWFVSPSQVYVLLILARVAGTTLSVSDKGYDMARGDLTGRWLLAQVPHVILMQSRPLNYHLDDLRNSPFATSREGEVFLLATDRNFLGYLCFKPSASSSPILIVPTSLDAALLAIDRLHDPTSFMRWRVRNTAELFEEDPFVQVQVFRTVATFEGRREWPGGTDYRPRLNDRTSIPGYTSISRFDEVFRNESVGELRAAEAELRDIRAASVDMDVQNLATICLISNLQRQGREEDASAAAYEGGRGAEEVQRICEPALSFVDSEVTPRALLVIAKVAVDSGDFVGAEDCYELTTRSGHQNLAPRAALWLGQLLEADSGQQTRARQAYDAAAAGGDEAVRAEALTAIARLSGAK